MQNQPGRIARMAACIFPCIFFFAACATANIDDGKYLAENSNSGYFTCIVSTVEPGWTLSLFPRNTEKDKGPFSQAVAVFETLPQGNNLLCIQLPAGTYLFQFARHAPFTYEMEREEVSVVSGKICYAGNLVFSLPENLSYYHDFKYAYADSYDAFTQAFRKKYPKLYEKYDLINCAKDSDPATWYIPKRRI
jgi:hypothetical protein